MDDQGIGIRGLGDAGNKRRYYEPIMCGQFCIKYRRETDKFCSHVYSCGELDFYYAKPPLNTLWNPIRDKLSVVEHRKLMRVVSE